jgi:hypothetical protein
MIRSGTGAKTPQLKIPVTTIRCRSFATAGRHGDAVIQNFGSLVPSPCRTQRRLVGWMPLARHRTTTMWVSDAHIANYWQRKPVLYQLSYRYICLVGKVFQRPSVFDHCAREGRGLPLESHDKHVRGFRRGASRGRLAPSRSTVQPNGISSMMSAPSASAI